VNECSFIFAADMRIRDENKVNSIREKAIEMIVGEGFDGLSMQKLAKAANVSPATIYIYFKNREDLLSQLYNHVQNTFSEVTLDGFSPELSFRDGLWLQWKNRFRFIQEHPLYFQFQEQFRNSPLINQCGVDISDFKSNMKNFVINAVKRGDMKPMEPEVFWSIAYGTLYSLIKFHLNERSMMNNNFTLTDEKMKQAFEMVIKAFKH
jgi:TetR/AcrR family transcriptional repressor of multidrug resistance operon